ncbi:Dynamin [Penicillium cf. griseofulvum]|uniref:Dynamin n=1 Tax=Penicillium cf. griseofulvum TaxID=2972120 RepID=A0A9W9T5Z3_9EURO|nr:Dynamin [Penicillium cf. griseofulvum]KAJ5422070.1 Dynamin [Penicillium cf. griseofulvum]
MSGPDKPDGALPQLQTDQVPLLDTIDRLRTLGVGELVNLPQIIVCGSKSNGKRSMIEEICRMGFPVKNDLYTGFITEIILRRHPTHRFKVSIEPGPSRKSETDLQRLKAFETTVHANTEQSASLIGKATQFLGSSTEDGFSDDIIKVEVSGPDQHDLTLIDMPGRYFTEATVDSRGKDPGHLCMEKYMLNPRSIILAVVSAKIDICVQKLLDFADNYDGERKRIMGIITHLDTLEPSSDEEKLWLKGIKQATSELPLGLHLVCTRSYETRDVLDEERDEKEKEFFGRAGWETVAKQSTGTGNLRRRLSTLLLDHVQSSLPGVISEIDKIIPKSQSRLAKLSAPRETIHQQKALLFNLSSAFHRITEQALNGMDDNKSKIHDPRRLRAATRDLHEDFADIMEIAGCRQFIHGVNNQITSVLHPCNPYANIRQPVHRSRSEFELEVSEQMRCDRGIEFPGNANQLLVGTLFRDQSQPWEEIARVHLMKSWECTLDFVTLLLDHLADERMSVVILRTVICPQLDRMEENLLTKLHELTAYNKRGHPLPLSRSFPRGHLLPLDRSFVAKMQKSRNDSLLANLQQMLPSTPGRYFNMEELKVATEQLESSSNPVAASDVVDQLQAYYNNALLTFMDNIATLGIENCLLGPLEAVLTTQTITNMEDKQIEELFADVHDGVQKSRDYLICELEKLRTGLRELKKFNVAKKATPSIATTKKSVPGSSHGCSAPQSFVMPQGIICSGASSNPFGVICTDSSVQGPNGTPRYQLLWPYSSAPDKHSSITLCPSGPFGLNAGTANAGTITAETVTAPSVSFATANPKPSSRYSEEHASFRLPLPPASAFKPSTFWSPPGPSPAGPAPNTRGYDPNWYWEEFDLREGKCINRCYSISYHDKFKYFSLEELRLADYQLSTNINNLFQLDTRLEEMKAAVVKGTKRSSDLL